MDTRLLPPSTRPNSLISTKLFCCCFYNVLLFFSFLLLLIVPFNFLLFCDSHPAPSSGTICHGPLHGVRYRYQYSTELQLNNDDNREATGFGAEIGLTLDNIWQDQHSYLARIQLQTVQFKPRANIVSGSRHKPGPVITDWKPILAYINGTTGRIVSLFAETDQQNTQHSLEPTQINLVLGLLNALRTRFDSGQLLSESSLTGSFRSGQTLHRRSPSNEIFVSQPLDSSDTHPTSLLSPRITDQWEIFSNLAPDHDVVELCSGWQNVSMESKLYPQAHSKLTASFKLRLLGEEASPFTIASPSGSLSQPVSSIVHQFGVQQGVTLHAFDPHLVAEPKPCEPHHCQSLGQFVTEYREQLSEERSLASTSISVAYLRLLAYLRTNSHKITSKEVLKLLQKYYKSREKDGNVFITLLDTFAGSRHPEALIASLEFLDLPKCDADKAQICERFLVSITVSALTSASMPNTANHHHRVVPEQMDDSDGLSSEQLINLLIPLSTIPAWKDDRVRHAYGMTIGTLAHSLQLELFGSANLARDLDRVDSSLLYADLDIKPYHTSSSSSPDVTQHVMSDQLDHHRQEIKLHHQSGHSPSQVAHILDKVCKYLIHQLESCKDTECRIVYLHSLANARVISKYGVFKVLKRYATGSDKRESLAAMKAIRSCVQFEYKSNHHQSVPLSEDKLLSRLRELLIRVVYDSNLDTSSRLIGAELLSLPLIDFDGKIMPKLIQSLNTFPAELATLIWKRAVETMKKQRPTNQLNDWNLRAKVLGAGSSDSFKYVMGGTRHANASYEVILEMFKGKLPKETYFSLELNNGQSIQHLVGVGLFARGLSSFAGSDSDDDSENQIADSSDADDSDSLAGLSLHILGAQLRPFLFFSSSSELMGHVWSGTGSEPTPVFRANLLMSDYHDQLSLVNGFILEQSLRGVFSLGLNGEIQISLWNRNSHSVVQTMGSILLQGSQEVLTGTQYRTSARKFFSFGGESKLDFITDFDFYSNPYRICIQITQPQFSFRHNTRKYEQVHSESLHRRIHRRSYKIPGKSYILNRDNSEMCSLMNSESTD